MLEPSPEAADLLCRRPEIQPPPRQRRSPSLPAAKKGKRQPTGDYSVGYARPPVASRFDGSKPGPGRPRGSLSHDTLLRKHLGKTRPVTIEGKRVKMSTRELAIMLRVKEALEEKKRHSLDYVLAQSQRLYAPSPIESGQDAPATAADLDATDARIFEEVMASLCARSGEPS